MAKIAHNLGARRSACLDSFPHIEIGWIGNAAHQAEQSDHNPDARGLVHAIDVMVIKTRAEAVVTWALAHPDDLEYVIHNRTIWTRRHDFRPKRYTGTDPHTNHVHISGRHGPTGENRATGTGYNTASEQSTPAGTPTKVPVPSPGPGPKLGHGPGLTPKTSSTLPVHKPGSRPLQLVSPHMSGTDILFVQRFIGKNKCGKADGFYGKDTIAGVKWYQDMRGIPVAGVVDARTWHNMGA
jgi:Putative peptidoglycan binding domain